MGQEPIIEYQNINKVYGENVAVEDINLKITLVILFVSSVRVDQVKQH